MTEIVAVRPDDPLVAQFRRSVVLGECQGFPPDAVDAPHSRAELMRIVGPHPTFEDGFRFTCRKFRDTSFDHILLQLHEGEPVSFSGAIDHGRHMKVAVYHYTLRRARAIPEVRGVLYRRGGFFDRHRDAAEGRQSLFFTIYAHNAKLRGYVDLLLGRRRSFESHDMSLLQEVRHGGRIIYNSFEQEVFYLPLVEPCPNPAEMFPRP